MPVDRWRQARRSFHSDEPSLHEIFEMREDRKAAAPVSAGLRLCKHWQRSGDRGVSGIEPGEDRFFAPAAMPDECAHKTLRLLDRAAMAGQ